MRIDIQQESFDLVDVTMLTETGRMFTHTYYRLVVVLTVHFWTKLIQINEFISLERSTNVWSHHIRISHHQDAKQKVS